MRIGITQRISKDPDYGELRDALSHDWIDYLTNISTILNDLCICICIKFPY